VVALTHLPCAPFEPPVLVDRAPECHRSLLGQISGRAIRFQYLTSAVRGWHFQKFGLHNDHHAQIVLEYAVAVATRQCRGARPQCEERLLYTSPCSMDHDLLPGWARPGPGLPGGTASYGPLSALGLLFYGSPQFAGVAMRWADWTHAEHVESHVGCRLPTGSGSAAACCLQQSAWHLIDSSQCPAAQSLPNCHHSWLIDDYKFTAMFILRAGVVTSGPGHCIVWYDQT
jgi:hypothetical protein